VWRTEYDKKKLTTEVKRRKKPIELPFNDDSLKSAAISSTCVATRMKKAMYKKVKLTCMGT